MNDQQLLRYSRHILLPDIGIEGQEKIRAAHALVIGAGGLGSPVALYLASAGIGTLTICDGDTVDLTNLQRQIVHRNDAIGTPKAESARNTLGAINPEVRVHAVCERLAGAALTGRVAAAFLVGYGAFRFIAEFFREPDAHLGYLSLDMSMGQWLCVPMVLGGIGLWVWAGRRH